MKILGVIPARWASTRFEGKVLADIDGRPMIGHVWERAKRCRLLEEVFIACDDDRVFRAAQGFGAQAVMTSPEHASGTERIAAAFADSDADIIINIQGDEPLIEPAVIDALAKAVRDNATVEVGTVIRPITQEDDLHNPHVVKVVVDKNGLALYFSRAAIPFARDKKGFQQGLFFKHLGLYAYRKGFLKNYKDLPLSRLEETEKLEQLRILEAGYRIMTVTTQYDSISVDTPEDLEKVSGLMKKGAAHG